MTTRLFRSRTDRMIGGVCGGVGHYLAIDPVIIRLFFVLLALSSGVGVFIYLLLWIVVPYEGPSQSAIVETAHAGAEEMAERARVLGNDLHSAVHTPNPQAGFIVGITLIALGVLFLFQNVLASFNIVWLRWLTFDNLWPLLLIVGGGVLLWRRTRIG